MMKPSVSCAACAAEGARQPSVCRAKTLGTCSHGLRAHSSMIERDVTDGQVADAFHSTAACDYAQLRTAPLGRLRGIIL